MSDSLDLQQAWEFLFDHIRNGVWILDTEGRIVQANPPILRWLEASNVVGTTANYWTVEDEAKIELGDATVELRSRSGVVRKVEAQTGKLNDPTGKFVGYIQVFTDQSTTRALESMLVKEVQRLAKLAGEDPLTGLANRRAFEDGLEHMRQELDRKFGLIVIDLDDFKSVNDTFGHQVGDRVLKMCADKLRNLVREDDLIARLGGDEFAVLLPHVNMVALTDAAERIRKGLVIELEFGENKLKVTSSLGYAHSGPDPSNVIERADKWMYQQKAIRESESIADMARAEETANILAG